MHDRTQNQKRRTSLICLFFGTSVGFTTGFVVGSLQTKNIFDTNSKSIIHVEKDVTKASELTPKDHNLELLK